MPFTIHQYVRRCLLLFLFLLLLYFIQNNASLLCVCVFISCWCWRFVLVLFFSSLLFCFLCCIFRISSFAFFLLFLFIIFFFFFALSIFILFNCCFTKIIPDDTMPITWFLFCITHICNISFRIERENKNRENENRKRQRETIERWIEGKIERERENRKNSDTKFMQKGMFWNVIYVCCVFVFLFFFFTSVTTSHVNRLFCSPLYLLLSFVFSLSVSSSLSWLPCQRALLIYLSIQFSFNISNFNRNFIFISSFVYVTCSMCKPFRINTHTHTQKERRVASHSRVISVIHLIALMAKLSS